MEAAACVWLVTHILWLCPCLLSSQGTWIGFKQAPEGPQDNCPTDLLQQKTDLARWSPGFSLEAALPGSALTFPGSSPGPWLFSSVASCSPRGSPLSNSTTAPAEVTPAFPVMLPCAQRGGAGLPGQ